jgi:DNA topoisomerase IB
VGTDDAGRKQYLYHEQWRLRRDQEKFDRMIEFASTLPKIRHLTNQHLEEKRLSRDRVLACAVRLLDRGFFRVGGEAYRDQNNTFGLATMRKDHVSLNGRAVIFEYVAKSGKERIQSVVDPAVYEVVAALKRRRSGGDELLAYKLGSSTWRDVKSNDINEYIKEISGGSYSAKDFRTWHATVHASVALAVSFAAVTSKTARKRAVTRAVKEVAHYLGNTPAVCRKSYIDPRVIDRYDAGVTIAGVLDELGAVEALDEPSLQGAVEDAVLDLIEERHSSPFVEKVAV